MLDNLPLSKRRTVAAVAVPVVYLIGRTFLSQGTPALNTLGLALFIAEVILLWPSARLWTRNPADFWLALAALAALGSVIRLFENAQRLEVPISVVLFFLVRCALFVFLAANFIDSYLGIALISLCKRAAASWRRPSTAWATIIVGTIIGITSVIVIIGTILFPLFTFMGDLATEATSPTPGRGMIIGGVFAVLLVLSAGPLTVVWGRPKGWQGRVYAGAVAGGLAGAYLFGGLGGWIAGTAAHFPLYALTLSRTSYDVSEWLLKLLVAVNAVFPYVYGTFWLLIEIGALLGGLTGLLTPARPVLASETPNRIQIWPLVTLVIVLPVLELAIIANAAMLPWLGSILRNVFDTYGYTPAWHPEWTFIVAVGQLWLVLTIVQVLGLRWLHQVPSGAPLRQLAARVAYFVGLLGFALPIVLYFLAGSMLLEEWWFLAISLITAILGLEMVSVGWRLRRLTQTDDSSGPFLPSLSDWTAVGVGSGILAAALSHQVAVILATLFHSAMMTAGLYETPDYPLAFSILLFYSLTIIFPLTGYAVISGHAGWALAHWHRAIQIRVRAVVDQAEARTGIKRQLPIRVLAILGLGAVLTILIIVSVLQTSITALSLTVLAILTVAITLVVARRRSIRRLPWAVWAFAFVLTLIGLVGLALGGAWADVPRLSVVGVVLVAAATGVTYRALTVFTPQSLRLRVRVTALIGVGLLLGLFGHLGQEEIVTFGGVSRFDGRRWEVFSQDNSALGGRLNYQLFSDSQGRLWYGGGTGLMIEHTAEGWRRHLLANVLTLWETWDRPREELIGARTRILEDDEGQLWVASGTTFGQFIPEQTTDSRLRRPGRSLIDSEQLDLDSPSLTTTYSGCRAGIAQLWDRNGNFVTSLAGHISEVNFAIFSPDSRRIVTGSEDAVRLWDTEGNFIKAFEDYDYGGFTSAAFNPDGTRIVTESWNGVWQWDADGNIISAQEVPNRRIGHSDVNPDGTRIVLVVLDYGDYGDYGIAQLWDIDGHFIAALQHEATSPVSDAARRGIRWASFRPDGRRIVTVSWDGRIRLWDADGNLLATPEGHKDVINSVTFSPDGTRLLTASDDNTARVWDIEGDYIAALEGHRADVTSAHFSPDGARILTTSNDDTARLWDLDGDYIAALEGHRADVTSAHFSQDGTRILTLSKDDTARLWDSDGDYIATLEGYRADVTSARFSPDGTRILTLSDDDTAHLWDSGGNFITALEGHAGRINSASFSTDGRRILTAECVSGSGYVTPVLSSPITDMTLDIAGNLWLATEEEGVLRLEADRPLDDARWQFLTSANSGLASDEVYLIFADRAGDVWFGTARGLSRFDGSTLEAVAVPGMDASTPAVAFLEDSEGMLLVGTSRGGSWWDGQRWASFDDTVGWPDGASVEALFEDSQGGLWAGTDAGALRFDGRRWINLVPDVHVTVFAEGPPDVVWIGGQQGLSRYDLATKETDIYDSENSGMVASWVRDLHVHPDGDLWVSTFAIDRNMRSPWTAIGLSVLFFGYLFINTYQGYVRTPETRGRRLRRKVVAEPASLYPAAYEVLVNTPDAPTVLSSLSSFMTRAQDRSGAEAITALAAIAPDAHIDEVVGRMVAALEADSDRTWAEPLRDVYDLLRTALAADAVSDIAGLELSVNPGPESGNVSLRTHGSSLEALPPFQLRGSTDAWYALEQVGVALRKYQTVDAATDRLSYLADALSAADAAQNAIRSLSPPDAVLLETVAIRWRGAVTREIHAISGRAELGLELRTRQVRRAEQVTLALRLQNAGRAAAENVVVSLQPGEGYAPVVETQVVLQRLSSGRSTPVEFAIAPAEAQIARVLCRVTWDDRVAKNNTIEFADVVRFYEVAEEFQRIPNPYIVGHPVKSPEMFYGRDDIFEFIADNLSGPVQDRTLVLHGQRRTGKTSVLYQLLRGRLGSDCVPVLLDMQEMAPLVNSTADFLGEVAYQLARAARKAGITIEEPAPNTLAESPTRTFSRFLDALEDNLGDKHAMLMFDEFELIESKIADGRLDADLLGYFRSLMQHRDRLNFIFTGTHRLEEMSHDYWSILFNIALYRRVSFLGPADAAQLIRKPVAGALDVDELAVEKIISLTRGHPYFIQLICWALVNHCNAKQRNYATINDVNSAVQEMLATGEAYFAYIWQQATWDQRLAMAGLAHTLRPGKAWARPSEILETLAAAGDTQTQRRALMDLLDQLVAQEVLEVAGEGTLRYRFQLEVLQLWIAATKPVAAVVERRQ